MEKSDFEKVDFTFYIDNPLVVSTSQIFILELGYSFEANLPCELFFTFQPKFDAENCFKN